MVVVGQPGSGADDMRRPGQRRELAAARHVVVVEMGLDDVGDAQVVGAGGVQVDVDVAARVDDGGDAGRLVGDERRQVPETLDPDTA